jgi:hypothetical protein
MSERSKFYPEHDTLISLGFQHLHSGEGEDPRDWWYEFDLTNKEWNSNLSIRLCLDAYFDFNLNISELEEGIPLNIQSIEELKVFLAILSRPVNQAFSFLLDISNNN